MRPIDEHLGIGPERIDYILGEVRAHGDIDLAAERAGVDIYIVRQLAVYAGDDTYLLDTSMALQIAQAEGKRNQKHYAKSLFLQALERHASVAEAVASQRWYTKKCFESWKARDPEFELAWKEAIERAVDKLRREAWRRGAEGYEEPAIHQGHFCYDPEIDLETGQETGRLKQVKVRKFSDGLLTLLLKRYDPAFRERMGVDMTASVDGGLTQDAAMKALGELSAEELAAVTKLLDATDKSNGPE